MKLNHLNLTVTDPMAACEFLERYFGLCARDGGNRGFQVLTDDNGMILTLIKGRAEHVKYPSTFHVGFIQESEQRVDDINRQLRRDGFEVDAPARLHGAWTFYFTAPGGFTIEVLA